MLLCVAGLGCPPAAGGCVLVAPMPALCCCAAVATAPCGYPCCVALLRAGVMAGLLPWAANLCCSPFSKYNPLSAMAALAVHPRTHEQLVKGGVMRQMVARIDSKQSSAPELVHKCLPLPS